MEQQPLSVLLHSRSVLEGEQSVATGVLSYLEGILMDIELSEYEQFQLGEQVKVTMYSPAGMHNFTTKIVARHQGSLMLVHPPHEQQKFNEKREYPRIEIRKHGFITSYSNEDGDMVKAPSPIPIHIMNISMKGIGLTISEDAVLQSALDVGSMTHAELHLGMELPCSIRLVRDRQQGNERFFGAAIEHMEEDAARSLQAFILSQQIHTHIENKSKQSRRS